MTNSGDSALTNVQAKVVNKVSVKQDQNYDIWIFRTLIESNTGWKMDDWAHPGYVSHPFDTIVPMTDIDTPFPIRMLTRFREMTIGGFLVDLNTC